MVKKYVVFIYEVIKEWIVFCFNLLVVVFNLGFVWIRGFVVEIVGLYNV